VFLIVFSVFFLGEKLSLTGVSGFLILLSGLLVISVGNSSPQRQNSPGKGIPTRASLLSITLAVLTAFFVATFSVIDGSAVRRTNSLTYTVIVFWLMLMIVTPIMFKFYDWKVIKENLSADWLKISVIGILSVVAYGLALAAFSIAPVGYSGAIRESSIIFGACGGWIFLKENFGWRRLVGALTAFVGIVVIGFA
jgi:drug/metabolite transporter (DMT)-like permease